MSISVTTRAITQQRTGWNYAESIQTPAKIRAQGIKLMREFHLWGDSRGSEGMPLVVADLTMRDGLQHDVLICNTMGGDVFAFDHQTLRPLWVQHLANPVPGTLAMDLYRINDNWAFLSTSALDLERGLSLHCGMASPDGSYEKSSWWVHILNLVDGSAACAPLNLAPAAYQPPDGLPEKVFGSIQRKQRCALLYDGHRNGASTLFVASGSFNEDGATNEGIIIAIDVTDAAAPKIAASLFTTPRYQGGGIWMSGGGPALDDKGFLFSVVGNGSFDGVTDFGESTIKVQYVPATSSAPASLAVVGHVTRFTDTGSVGGAKYQTLASTTLIPGAGQEHETGTSNMDDKGDMDENSGAVTILLASMTGFSRNLAFYCGKGGISVLADADNMPNPSLADFAADTIQAAVYDHILNLTGFTFYPADMSITPTDLSLLQSTYGGYTHHLHANAVYYQSPTAGALLFGGGENGPVRVFKVTEPTDGVFEVTYQATGTAMASPGMAPPGGMPGWMISGWSDGSKPGTGAIVCVAPYGNANNSVCNGRMVVYAADGWTNGEIEVLWDSEQWAVDFVFNKFGDAVCINGIIDYFSYDAKVLQFE